MKAAQRHFLASWGCACWPARSRGLATVSILSSGGGGWPPWRRQQLDPAFRCPVIGSVNIARQMPGSQHRLCVPDLSKSSGAPGPSPPDMGRRGSREGSLGLQPEAPPLGAQQEYPVPQAKSSLCFSYPAWCLVPAPSSVRQGIGETGHTLRCQILLAHEIVLLLREA